MANCKLCSNSVATGVVVHRDCANKVVEKVVEDVCHYRCKWAAVCEDKKKLRERHCTDCGMTKLSNLVKEGGSDA